MRRSHRPSRWHAWRGYPLETTSRRLDFGPGGKGPQERPTARLKVQSFSILWLSRELSPPTNGVNSNTNELKLSSRFVSHQAFWANDYPAFQPRNLRFPAFPEETRWGGQATPAGCSGRRFSNRGLAFRNGEKTIHGGQIQQLNPAIGPVNFDPVNS